MDGGGGAEVVAVCPHPPGSDLLVDTPTRNGAETENATPGTRYLAASMRAGYVAVTVARDPTVAAWHAHME